MALRRARSRSALERTLISLCWFAVVSSLPGGGVLSRENALSVCSEHRRGQASWVSWERLEDHTMHLRASDLRTITPMQEWELGGTGAGGRRGKHPGRGSRLSKNPFHLPADVAPRCARLQLLVAAGCDSADSAAHIAQAGAACLTSLLFTTAPYNPLST